MICEKCKEEYFEDYRKSKRSRKLPSRFCSSDCRRAFNASKVFLVHPELLEKTCKCPKCKNMFKHNNINRHIGACNGIYPKVIHHSSKGRTYEEIYGVEKAKELKKNLSKVMKEKTYFKKIVWNDERRENQSDRKKKLYLEHPEKHPNRILANNKTKMSYPEKIAYDFLVENSIKFEHQFQVECYFVDFYLNDFDLIIEIDGEYWHDKEHDDIRDAVIMKKYKNILRIKAKERIEDTLREKLFPWSPDKILETETIMV